jgi:hypothetical protein
MYGNDLSMKSLLRIQIIRYGNMILAKDLSPDAQFAFACFIVAECNRHQKDIDNGKADLERLREMGVDVDRAYDMGFVTTEDT